MNKMGSWVYGLMEENGNLELCEVYIVKFSKEWWLPNKKNTGFLNLNWKNIKKHNVELIKKDICEQLDAIVYNKKNKYKFKLKY